MPQWLRQCWILCNYCRNEIHAPHPAAINGNSHHMRVCTILCTITWHHIGGVMSPGSFFSHYISITYWWLNYHIIRLFSAGFTHSGRTAARGVTAMCPSPHWPASQDKAQPLTRKLLKLILIWQSHWLEGNYRFGRSAAAPWATMRLLYVNPALMNRLDMVRSFLENWRLWLTWLIISPL